MKLAWKLLAFVAMLVVAVAAARLGRMGLAQLISDHWSFFDHPSWFNAPVAILCCFELLFFFAFGMLVARLFRFSTPISWAFAFGAICGAFHFLMSWDYIKFQASSSWSVYVWVCVNYVAPALGALLGALALQLVPNNSLKRTAADGLR